MAGLFAPDNHAPDFPVYAPVPDSVGSRLRQWLLLHYGHVFSGQEEVLALAGANINSSNFRVGDHYVKILKRRPARDYVETFPRISALLQERNIPCAMFEPNSAGAQVSQTEDADGEHYLYAQRFIDANYFRGSAVELEAVLPLLAPMSEALARLKPTAGQRDPYASMELGTELEGVAAALAGRDADPFAQRVVAVLPEVREIATEFHRHRARLNLSGLHHFDLHPHNLLTFGGRVAAILDLESFRALPFEISAAFTLYKLGRKAVASGNLVVADFRALAANGFDLPALAWYARVELARRITVVASLHFLHGNQAWDADLLKHARGLREADQLLGTA